VTRRTTDFLVFGLLGAATALALLWIEWRWLEIAARLMGRPYISFDQQLPWIRNLHDVLAAVPWVIGLGLLLFAIWKSRWIPFLAFAGAQVVGVCAIVATIFAGPMIKDYATREPFDAAIWRAENTHSATGIRVHMVDDLLRRHSLVGMTRAQIDELLGVPPPSNYFREYDYVYWLGQERGAFGIDSEWLVLKLEKGCVSTAKVVTD
jgi:hypothetical protein